MTKLQPELVNTDSPTFEDLRKAIRNVIRRIEREKLETARSKQTETKAA